MVSNDELKQIDKLYHEKEKYSSMANIDLETFINVRLTYEKEDLYDLKHAINNYKGQIESKKKDLNTNRRLGCKDPSTIWSIIGAVVCFCLCVLFIGLTISNIVKKQNYDNVINSPGQEFDAWFENWENIDSWESLEPKWSNVEQAWSNRGIKIDWKFVNEIKESFYTYEYQKIYPDVMRRSILDKMKNVSENLIIPIVLESIAAIVFGVGVGFCIKVVCEENKYSSNFVTKGSEKRRKQNLENDIYKLEESYKKSLEEYKELKENIDNEIKNLTNEYNEKQPKSAQKLEEINKKLSQFDFPEEYYCYAGQVRAMLIAGRAKTLGEALNIIHQEEMQKDFNNKMVAEQQRKNDLLAQQMEDQNYYYEQQQKQMEEFNRQLEFQANQPKTDFSSARAVYDTKISDLEAELFAISGHNGLSKNPSRHAAILSELNKLKRERDKLK